MALGRSLGKNYLIGQCITELASYIIPEVYISHAAKSNPN